MIIKKSTYLFIYFLFVSVVIFSCTDNENKTKRDSNFAFSKMDVQEVEDVNSKNFDSSNITNIKLTLSRGAFHWDSFQLIGNELTYVPAKDDSSFEDYPEYQKGSKVILSDSIVESLIKELIENNILELEANYDSMSSCNSMLEVEIKINNIEKKISCSDFKRGCPEVLINLENELIKLHGKNLKRILLPG